MKKTSLVQARIDATLKEKAENYFHSFGMDSASAIRIFFAKVAETGRIPFAIGLEPEDTPDEKKCKWKRKSLCLRKKKDKQS